MHNLDIKTQQRQYVKKKLQAILIYEHICKYPNFNL